MKNGYIALLDSGIGGISLLLELEKILPNENYLYLGDNYNAPYGNKTIAQLRDITLKNIDLIKKYDVKVLVVACNTLSVNLLSDIRDYSGLITFGVFPPVEKICMQNKRSLLLATERTAENYKGLKNLTSVGLKTLAIDIERNKFNLSSLSMSDVLNKTNCSFINKPCYYDTVILGCTHYFFIKNKIFDHFRPRKIIFGEIFTAKVVSEFLKNEKLLGNYRRNQVLFIGENANQNRSFYKYCGQNNIK